MELLTYPKTDYLLNSSLKSLHTESQEWIKEIEFWKDEMAFFFKFIRRKSKEEDAYTTELEEIQVQVIATTEKLNTIKNKVKSHEQALASLFKDVAFQEENNYREAHKTLLKEIYDLHLLIKKIKREIFSLMRKP